MEKLIILQDQNGNWKKKSRLITCNERLFRWTISPAENFLKFIAEGQENKGRKIEVRIKSDIDRFWVEFPHVLELDLKIVTPKEAALFILYALEDGWNPDKKGRSIKHQLTTDGLSRA